MGPLRITRYRAQLGVHARYFLVRLLKENPRCPAWGATAQNSRATLGDLEMGKMGEVQDTRKELVGEWKAELMLCRRKSERFQKYTHLQILVHLGVQKLVMAFCRTGNIPGPLHFWVFGIEARSDLADPKKKNSACSETKECFGR